MATAKRTLLESIELESVSAQDDPYATHCRPALSQMLSILRLNTQYSKGEGSYLETIIDGQPRQILDVLGGYGSLYFGHNHPELVLLLRNMLDRKTVVHAQVSDRNPSGELAKKLIALAGAPYIVQFGNTGTEATEIALKHALFVWEKRRQVVLHQLSNAGLKLRHELLKQPWSPIALSRLLVGQRKVAALVKQVQEAKPSVAHLSGSFHGKTIGSLGVTSSAQYRLGLQTGFVGIEIDPRSSETELGEIFASQIIDLGEEQKFSLIAAVFIEPIQGEGGIRPLGREFVSALARSCVRNSVPLVSDEIQTGMYRTGPFLAAQYYALKPDYILLGKALGGGLTKISATMIARDLYQEEFGILHSSTFAEDDVSAQVALATIDLIDPREAKSKAAYFERRILIGLSEIQARYPDVIKEIRGRGFMIGVELDVENLAHTMLAQLIGDSGLLAYLCASFLLHKHSLRVAATLNESQTLRIEPSSLISDIETNHILGAFEDLARILCHTKYEELTAHLTKFNGVAPPSELELAKPGLKKPSRNLGTQEIPRVGFLCHFVDGTHIQQADPLLKRFSPEQCEAIFELVGPRVTSYETTCQRIRGANGKEIMFGMRGIPIMARLFEKSLRQGHPIGRDRVQEAVKAEEALGSKWIGLGQFTSVVTFNGLDLQLQSESDSRLTTGNTLTTGFAYETVLSAIKQRGLSTNDLTIGIVGPAGNIGCVLSQLLADHCREMILIHREPLEVSSKFRQAYQEISRANRKTKIRATHEIEKLIECDVVILCTNSTAKILKSEYLRRHAIVVDISVPSNLDIESLIQRPDLECFMGGYARLPYGQIHEDPIGLAPQGEVFACMAETMVLGLTGQGRIQTTGPVSKANVRRMLELAKLAGFEVGSRRPIRAVSAKPNRVSPVSLDGAREPSQMPCDRD